MTASATGSFWEECRRARPDLAAVEPRVRRFGNTPDVCRNLLNLIVAGEKTATFSLLWEHEASGEPLPRRGDVYIVTDYEGAPGCAIRILNVSSVPYRDIGIEQTRHEGPLARSVEAWRRIHWPYWTAALQKIGRGPTEDMIVLFQQFEVVYAAP